MAKDHAQSALTHKMPDKSLTLINNWYRKYLYNNPHHSILAYQFARAQTKPDNHQPINPNAHQETASLAYKNIFHEHLVDFISHILSAIMPDENPDDIETLSIRYYYSPDGITDIAILYSHDTPETIKNHIDGLFGFNITDFCKKNQNIACGRNNNNDGYYITTSCPPLVVHLLTFLCQTMALSTIDTKKEQQQMITAADPDDILYYMPTGLYLDATQARKKD